MTNLFRKHSKKKLIGAATLIVTIILLICSTLIIIFAANQGRLLQKITANQTRNTQAFQAAVAGLEFGINYLQQNSETILANPVSGHIPAFSNSSINNVVLANGSRFTITYSNPIANNYTLINIASTGVSDDGSSTRAVSQNVQFGSVVASPPAVPLITKSNLTMGGSAQIINTVNNNTIQSGAGVVLNGNASTVLNSGTSSTPGNIGGDVQQNISAIADMSQQDYFATFFGVSADAVKNNVAHLYSNTTDTNYSGTLNGMTGTSIWINQTNGRASISGNTVIGSPTAPVLMIIDGDLDLSGNVEIYGFVFVLGTATTDILGNVDISGGMVTSANFNMTGNTTITYNPTILTNLQNLETLRYYAKVPGSWKDF